MSFYYVNDSPQYNGDHEVHEQGCCFMPVNKTFLGDFSNYEDAVKEAVKVHPRAVACVYCLGKYQHDRYHNELHSVSGFRGTGRAKHH